LSFRNPEFEEIRLTLPCRCRTVRDMESQIREQEPVVRFTGAELRAFGARLSEQRERTGWIQRELSRRTEIRTPRLSNIERGKASPRLDELARLSRALDLSLDDLVYGPSPLENLEPQELLRTLLSSLARPEEREALTWVLRRLVHGYRTEVRP
jgi:transcriptional regulator with XRE-family HTH domain